MNLTIEIEDVKQKSLEFVALQNGKLVSDVITELIDEFLRSRKIDSDETNYLTRLSQTSFNEWDNEDDAIYDNC
jgi:hypothetical protein